MTLKPSRPDTPIRGGSRMMRVDTKIRGNTPQERRVHLVPYFIRKARSMLDGCPLPGPVSTYSVWLPDITT